MVAAWRAVGVPEIVQSAPKLRPEKEVAIAGLDEQLVAASPVFVGVAEVIATLFVSANGLPE